MSLFSIGPLVPCNISPQHNQTYLFLSTMFVNASPYLLFIGKPSSKFFSISNTRFHMAYSYLVHCLQLSLHFLMPIGLAASTIPAPLVVFSSISALTLFLGALINNLSGTYTFVPFPMVAENNNKAIDKGFSRNPNLPRTLCLE